MVVQLIIVVDHQQFIVLSERFVIFSGMVISALALALQFGTLLASPNLNHYHQSAACCGTDNINTLYACIKSVKYGSEDIALVSYASSDITEYATYAFGVNSAYAEQHNYEFHIADDGGEANSDPHVTRCTYLLTT